MADEAALATERRLWMLEQGGKRDGPAARHKAVTKTSSGYVEGAKWVRKRNELWFVGPWPFCLKHATACERKVVADAEIQTAVERRNGVPSSRAECWRVGWNAKSWRLSHGEQDLISGEARDLTLPSKCRYIRRDSPGDRMEHRRTKSSRTKPDTGKCTSGSAGASTAPRWQLINWVSAKG